MIRDIYKYLAILKRKKKKKIFGYINNSSDQNWNSNWVHKDILQVMSGGKNPIRSKVIQIR